MKLDDGKKVFQLFIGEKTQTELNEPTIAGHGFHYEGDEHYLLKLMMIPNVSYFLVKNPSAQVAYTVYTKCFYENGRQRFQNPVGFAKLKQELKHFMEIELPLFKTSVFMSLYPKHFEMGA
jgi:hypothetical protein